MGRIASDFIGRRPRSLRDRGGPRAIVSPTRCSMAPVPTSPFLRSMRAGRFWLDRVVVHRDRANADSYPKGSIVVRPGRRGPTPRGRPALSLPRPGLVGGGRTGFDVVRPGGPIEVSEGSGRDPWIVRAGAAGSFHFRRKRRLRALPVRRRRRFRSRRAQTYSAARMLSPTSASGHPGMRGAMIPTKPSRRSVNANTIRIRRRARANTEGGAEPGPLATPADVLPSGAASSANQRRARKVMPSPLWSSSATSVSW